ncbi:MAG: leucine-rich repeat domain-containing protein [Candidatus Helarchaeota archaeon]
MAIIKKIKDALKTFAKILIPVAGGIGVGLIAGPLAGYLVGTLSKIGINISINQLKAPLEKLLGDVSKNGLQVILNPQKNGTFDNFLEKLKGLIETQNKKMGDFIITDFCEIIQVELRKNYNLYKNDISLMKTELKSSLNELKQNISEDMENFSSELNKNFSNIYSSLQKIDIINFNLENLLYMLKQFISNSRITNKIDSNDPSTFDLNYLSNLSEAQIHFAQLELMHSSNEINFNPKFYVKRDIEDNLNAFINNNNSKFFILLGPEGCGKTWLFSNLALNFFNDNDNDNNIIFFFNMGKDISYQMDWLFGLYWKQGCNLIRNLSDNQNFNIIIFLDGLDECSDYNKIISAFQTFKHSSHVKIFASSRYNQWYDTVYSELIRQDVQFGSYIYNYNNDHPYSSNLDEFSSEELKSALEKYNLDFDKSSPLFIYCRRPFFLRLVHDIFKLTKILPDPEFFLEFTYLFFRYQHIVTGHDIPAHNTLLFRIGFNNNYIAYLNKITNFILNNYTLGIPEQYFINNLIPDEFKNNLLNSGIAHIEVINNNRFYQIEQFYHPFLLSQYFLKNQLDYNKINYHLDILTQKEFLTNTQSTSLKNFINLIYNHKDIFNKINPIILNKLAGNLNEAFTGFLNLKDYLIENYPHYEYVINYVNKQINSYIISELENMIGKPIPKVNEIKWDTFGMVLDDNKILGLGLYECRLKNLPESFGSLKSLQELDLQDNQLTTLPDSFGNLKSLQTLRIHNNKLENLPDSFGNLKSLQTLRIHNNKLENLPESFGDLKSLQELELQYNQLTTLPDSFGNLKSLQELNLWNNKLTTLPESFGNLKSLQELELRCNQLTTLPESFGDLKSLQTLKIYNNKLTTLPESFGDLKSLQELELRCNQLTTLPESFCNLINLKELILWGNKLTNLPEPILELKNLQVLYLGGNKLENLPDSFGDLESLQKLDLSFNELTNLPEPILKLTNLQILDLSWNQLTTLPDSFGNLKSLQELNLWNNKLTTLPEPILKLTNLQILDLSWNQLTTLPDSFGNLKSLQTLDLRHNQLETLPVSLCNMLNLKKIYISMRLLGEQARQVIEQCKKQGIEIVNW